MELSIKGPRHRRRRRNKNEVQNEKKILENNITRIIENNTTRMITKNTTEIVEVGKDKKNSVENLDLAEIAKDIPNLLYRERFGYIFTKEEQISFWNFIRFVRGLGNNLIITQYSLISIALTYSRADLNFFERIYLFLVRFISISYQKQINQLDISRINRIISFGQAEFNNTIINSNKKIYTLNQYKPYPEFPSIFLKYRKGTIPTMLLDSKTYPGFNHN